MSLASLTRSAPVTVSRETSERLDVFLALLRDWNRTTLLVAPSDLNHLRERHVSDSLGLVPLLGAARRIGDVGSGGGFPGLVLALVGNRHVVLTESDRRKAAFLREAVRLTAAPAEVHAGRFETAPGPFDLITARAVAPLARMLPIVSPQLADGGRCLFPKGRTFQAELAAARQAWAFQVVAHASPTAPDSRILEISAVQRCPP